MWVESDDSNCNREENSYLHHLPFIDPFIRLLSSFSVTFFTVSVSISTRRWLNLKWVPAPESPRSCRWSFMSLIPQFCVAPFRVCVCVCVCVLSYSYSPFSCIFACPLRDRIRGRESAISPGSGGVGLQCSVLVITFKSSMGRGIPVIANLQCCPR